MSAPLFFREKNDGSQIILMIDILAHDITFGYVGWWSQRGAGGLPSANDGRRCHLQHP